MSTRKLSTKILAAFVVAVIVVGAVYYYYASVPPTTVPTKPVVLTVGAATVGGTSYSAAVSASKILMDHLPAGSKVTVVEGGAVSNLERMAAGTLDFGLSTLSTFRGFKNPKVVGLFDLGSKGPIQLFIREDTGITSIEQIKERKYPLKLVTYPRGSVSVVFIEELLKNYGITFDDIKSWGGSVTHTTITELFQGMQDGHYQAFVIMMLPPASQVQDLSLTVKLRILPFREEFRDYFDKSGFAKFVLKKGSYPFVDQDVPTNAVLDVYAVRADLPVEVVYTVTKILSEHAEEWNNANPAQFKFFNPKTAWTEMQPLHPGAEKYFKDAGYMPK